MDAVIVRVIDLPFGVRGMTIKDEEGDYNIYLNGKYSSDIRADAFHHEVEHIIRNHFYSPKSVREKESEIPF